MTPQHERMARLIDDIVEQAKDIDPSGFNLTKRPGSRRLAKCGGSRRLILAQSFRIKGAR